MQFDLRTLPLAARYKLLNSTVTPRPIAWVTTRSREGIGNTAPHSFFNVVGDEPPMLVLGLLKHPITGRMKDTAQNIVDTGEFVVNLVSEHDAERMNLCSVDAPADVDEAVKAGLEMLPSSIVAPPRIASSPVGFECRKLMALDIGPRQTVVLGEILIAHIDDRFILDADKCYLDTPAMRLIGRLHGSGWYTRASADMFKMERPRAFPD